MWTRTKVDKLRVAVAVCALPRNRQGGYRMVVRLLWLGLLLGLCLLALNVRAVDAQSPTVPPGEPATPFSIKRLRIQVMPEFDDPRVLVIVQGRLDAPGTAFPQSITFRVPRGAQINQMATMDMATGATTPRSYDAEPDPDDSRWSLVTYSLDNAHFFYEFYYDPLAGETDKQFGFAYVSSQPISELVLEIQQPLAATNFTLAPPATVARADENIGFTYHQFDMGSLEAGEEVMVEVSYTKADPEPSLTREQVMAMMGETAAELPSAQGPGQASGSSTWIFLLGGVLLVTVGGFMWYNRHPHTSSPVPRVPRATPRSRVAEVSGPSAGGSSTEFCTQCGTILKAGARFCHVCGTACEAVSD